jgi:hypothetical protein
LPFIVTVQGFVPEQPPPDHPVKIDPVSAAAERVTFVFGLYDSEQSKPQLIPDGEEVTDPEPFPDLVMVRA